MEVIELRYHGDVFRFRDRMAELKPCEMTEWKQDGEWRNGTFCRKIAVTADIRISAVELLLVPQAKRREYAERLIETRFLDALDSLAEHAARLADEIPERIARMENDDAGKAEAVREEGDGQGDA